MTDRLNFVDVNNTQYEVSARNGLPVALYPLPKGATPVYASSGNVAAAIAAATITGQAGLETWFQGFMISGAGATSGLPVIVTLTGLLGGTLSFIYTAVAGVLLSNTPLIFMPPAPLKAAAVGGNIVVSCPSLGAGNTNNTANIFGFVH